MESILEGAGQAVSPSYMTSPDTNVSESIEAKYCVSWLSFDVFKRC